MMIIRMLRALVSVCLIAGTMQAGQTTLAERYRAGKIVFRADEDWTGNLPSDLVFETRADIAVAPDGSVFVSNANRGTIYKFGPDGKFVKRFGQPGQGPGDLNSPLRLSVLDGKYLVIGEYALTQRISLFDLDGKFFKVVRTGRSSSHPLALKDGKVAYTSLGTGAGRAQTARQDDVYIIDTNSGAQTKVAGYTVQNPMKRLPGRGMVTSGEGGIAMARTADGGLVVGTTQSPVLDVFSADGVKLRSIDTGWTAIPVTAGYRAAYWALERKEAEASGRKLTYDEPLLLETLPVLRDVWTDSEGNILVCRKTECLEGCPAEVRAYSPTGDYLCDFVIDPGPLVLAIDWRFKRFTLTASGLYGLLELKDDPDGFLHLVRSVFRPQ